MVAVLLKDWIVRLSLFLWCGGMALYVVPGIPESWAVEFGGRYYHLPTVLPPMLAAFVGLRRLPEPLERRFWLIIGSAFAAWFAVSLPYAFVPDESWSRGADLLLEIGWVTYYLLLLVAIELRPHEYYAHTLAERERLLRTTGLTLLGIFLLAYFALVPAIFAPAEYDSAVPSFVMYVLVDLFITGRLLWMRRETWSVRWSVLYAWLATATTMVLVGDVMEATNYALDNAEALASGHWQDLLWTLPGVLFTIAVRARHLSFTAEQSVLNETSLDRRHLRAGQILGIGAGLLPFVHYTLYAAGILSDSSARPLREVVAMLSMVTVGGFALAAYRSLERDREAMAATQRELSEELNVARKMDAVARLAGSIAHDFNNLVQVVRGRAEIIGQQIDVTSPINDDVRQIRAAATRAADLASQLMTFGRRQQVALSTVRLHDVLRRCEKLLGPLVDDDRQLVMQLKASRDLVRIDPLQFERILVNLATNARDAMPDGGSITIATFSQSTAGFERVVVRVTDTGIGMDAETVSHIFEPFYTTKQGKGSGLGLAIVHGLVQQFGGSIAVDSLPGRGTTFSITLPVVAEGGGPGTSTVEHAPPSAILIVDGDTTNRQLLRRVLGGLDYPVLATATAAEALLIAERYAGPVAAAVIDVSIDGGRTLAHRLRDAQPDLRVLLLAQDQPIDLNEGDVMLREPFEVSDVLASVTELVRASER